MQLKFLKYALILFAVVDVLMFLISQTRPGLLIAYLPQFDIESVDNTYPRLVGMLFLMLGLARLYGALYIKEKGAFVLSMWSWVVELTYTVSELSHGQFVLVENLMGLTLAPLMLIWSFLYYRRNFS
jgi:hypothetical protein